MKFLEQVFATAESLFKFARAQDYGWPLRQGRAGWAIVTNLRRQREIFQLLRRPAFASLRLPDARFAFKYAVTNYLARGLTHRERADCFLHHYRRLHEEFSADLLRRTFDCDVTLFETRKGGCHYSVAMSVAKKSDFREGELILELKAEGARIYVLQFTVVPGSIVQSPSRDVLLISRLQGVRGRYAQIHSATKDIQEIAPPALLVTVLHGIAKAWGVTEMAGVSATSQTCFGDDDPEMFHKAYDEFFLELGATQANAKFFACPFQENKPIAPVRNGHKSRKRKKRAFKLHVANEVSRMIREGNAEPCELPNALILQPREEISARSLIPA